MNNEKVCLYKKRDDGSVGMLEVNSRMFSDMDKYLTALDLYYEMGYMETREDAENYSPPGMSI